MKLEIPLVRKLLLAVALPLAIASVSQAAVLTTPPGLDPGSSYRIMFITTTTRNATSLNINDYNNFVDAAANANGSLLQPLGATWKAIASVPGISGATNIGGVSSVPIYLMDGTLVANDTADLWDTTIAHTINLTELGTTTTSQFAWTGTLSGGGIDGFPLGYTGDAQNRVTRGRTDTLIPHQWVQNSLTSKFTSYPMYGISSVLTTPVPEPSACLLGAVGCIGLLRRRR